MNLSAGATDEMEKKTGTLYWRQNFTMSPSLHHLLHGSIKKKNFVCVCVLVYRSGQLIEPLYQVWEELADTELLPTKKGQQVRGQEIVLRLKRVTAVT